MGDLGLPGSVVEMPEPGPQAELWEVRKAGLNIMMSMKGDGKPVSFIEDCAVPLEHLADYTSASPTSSPSTAPRAPGTPTPRSAPCMCGRSSTCAARARRRCGRSPRKPRRWCASTRAPFRASTATGWCARMGGLAVRAAPHQGVGRGQGPVRSRGPAQSRQDRAAPEDGRPLAVPLQAGLQGRSTTSPRSTGRRGTSRTIR